MLTTRRRLASIIVFLASLSARSMRLARRTSSSAESSLRSPIALRYRWTVSIASRPSPGVRSSFLSNAGKHAAVAAAVFVGSSAVWFCVVESSAGAASRSELHGSLECGRMGGSRGITRTLRSAHQLANHFLPLELDLGLLVPAGALVSARSRPAFSSCKNPSWITSAEAFSLSESIATSVTASRSSGFSAAAPQADFRHVPET